MLAQCGLGDKWINSQFLTTADDSYRTGYSVHEL